MSYYQTIYNRLRYHGVTQAGALGILGNFDCESNCEPNRLQGDFSPYRSTSKKYVYDVTSGRIDRDRFSNDQKGDAEFFYILKNGNETRMGDTSDEDSLTFVHDNEKLRIIARWDNETGTLYATALQI